MLIRIILAIALLVLNSCGGGSRGTGDLTLSGSALSTTGQPIANATVTVAATGDSTRTDAQGNFSLQTAPFAGNVELILEINGSEVVSRGGEITEDVEEVVVNVRVELRREKPEAKQEIEIRKRRNKPEQEDRDEGSKGSGEVPTPTPSPRAGDKSENSGKNNNRDQNNGGSSEDSDNHSGGQGSDDSKGDNNGDDSSNDNHGSGSDSSDNNKPSPTETPRPSDSDSEQKLSLRGKIDGLGADYLSLRSYTIFVDQHTEFDKRRSLAEFQVGEEVDVKAELKGQRWIALEVKLRD